LRNGGGGRTIELMSLLAYSLRRAAGALLVFLVVIWLIMLGIYHITLPPLRGITIFPDGVEAWIRAQPALAAEWTIAALEVGVAAFIVLGLGAAWRFRRRARP
jgi:predicted cobalt transporter CbtA